MLLRNIREIGNVLIAVPVRRYSPEAGRVGTVMVEDNEGRGRGNIGDDIELGNPVYLIDNGTGEPNPCVDVERSVGGEDGSIGIGGMAEAIEIGELRAYLSQGACPKGTGRPLTLELRGVDFGLRIVDEREATGDAAAGLSAAAKGGSGRTAGSHGARKCAIAVSGKTANFGPGTGGASPRRLGQGKLQHSLREGNVASLEGARHIGFGRA